MTLTSGDANDGASQIVVQMLRCKVNVKLTSSDRKVGGPSFCELFFVILAEGQNPEGFARRGLSRLRRGSYDLRRAWRRFWVLRFAQTEVVGRAE